MKSGLIHLSGLLLIIACGDPTPEDPFANYVANDALLPLDAQVVDQGSNCVPRNEICNGLDDDCDGDPDELDAVQAVTFDDVNNCGACGHVCMAPNAEVICQVSECRIARCAPGFVDYNADFADGCEDDCIITAGGRESCDNTDNDCDGAIDETFDFMSDLGHCGACDVQCPYPPNASPGCLEGRCGVADCDADWIDLDGDPANGCEYNCTVRSTIERREACNGLDDDCDGTIDEGEDLNIPEDTCGELGVCAIECAMDGDCEASDRCKQGVCVPALEMDDALPCETDAECHQIHPGLACLQRSRSHDAPPLKHCTPRRHGPICDGERGFRCARGPHWQAGSELGACDSLDNDCDGRVDEDFVAALFLEDRRTPRPCTVGIGECARNGHIQCTANGETTACDARPRAPRSPIDDDCDGFDGDCDGVADEDHVDVFINLGGLSIYAYEASRPGATSGAPGVSRELDDARAGLIETRACSRPNVKPWANVDWQTAADACEAAGARLCTPAEWMRACGGPRGESYPYGQQYVADRCNGGENDADPGRRGVQDEVLPTAEMADCVRRGVHDLSGNLKEWVAEPDIDLGAVRGGGYATNLPGGMACGQASDLKPLEFRHDSIGFRCCR